jgi:EmrB/QacA subfamily drug resistance transporter
MKMDRRKVTWAMLIGTFLGAIEGTIVSTAMPSIIGDLGGARLIGWVFAVYSLTVTVSTAIFGKMSDIFGRKKAYLLGAGLFLTGSMLSGMSETMGQLIAFRALQGIGAGALVTTIFTVIGDLYPYEERAKIQGWFSSVWGISGIAGPLVGGFLVDAVSWRWIFYLNLPFGVVSVVLVWLYLNEKESTGERKPVDVAGAATFVAGMSALLLALLTGGTEFPWSSPLILSLFAGSAVLISAFLLIESRTRDPMLPLGLFRNPAISFSTLSGFLTGAILIAVSVYIPLWVQGIYGQGATGAGLTLLPMSISWPLSSVIAGRLMLKWGPKRTALFGVFLLLLGTVRLSSMTAETPQWQLILTVLAVGAGFGFAYTVTTVIVQSAVGWHLRGAANGANTFLRALGQTVGIAVFGALFNHLVASRFHGTRLGIDDFNRLYDSGKAALSPEMAENLREALIHGLHGVFMVLVGIAAIALLVTSKLPGQKPEPDVQSEQLERA